MAEPSAWGRSPSAQGDRGPSARGRSPPAGLLRSGRSAIAGARGVAGLRAGRSRGTGSAAALVHEAGVFLLHRLAGSRLLALCVCPIVGRCLRLLLVIAWPV